MRRNRTIGLCSTLILFLILVGGFALETGAQTPAAPATPSAPPTPSEPAKPAPEATPQPAAPQSQMQKAPDTPAPGTQTETRTERIVEHERSFLGVDPTVAMIIGAVLLIVIVFAMVAMGRRRDEIEHTHYNQPRI